MSTQIPLSQDLTGFAASESIVLHRPAHLLEGYMLLLSSLHAQCVSSHSRRGITKTGLTRVGGQYYKALFSSKNFQILHHIESFGTCMEH